MKIYLSKKKYSHEQKMLWKYDLEKAKSTMSRLYRLLRTYEMEIVISQNRVRFLETKCTRYKNAKKARTRKILGEAQISLVKEVSYFNALVKNYNDLITKLDTYLDLFEEQDKTICKYYFIDSMSVHEIAEELNLDHNTIRMTIVKVMNLFIEYEE